MSASNSYRRTPPANDPLDGEEVQCKACHGSGEDRYGSDCLSCDGYGTLII